jgi:ACS family sodium-dependent inorganic phosphate cotransporter
MVAFLAFLGFFNVYALRVNLSVAIVAMTTYRNITMNNGTTIIVSQRICIYYISLYISVTTV